MDEALGPPPQMAAKADELTPMLSQYLQLCERYDDALVLFQVGDFYETFCDAAEATARVLEITLTQREDSTGTYPMAGVPVDNAESYIERLLEAGYRVAVADQVEDPAETSSLVERAVTRIVTPGTLTETELLGGADNNFVACLADGYGLALLDVSTGDFYATRLDRVEAVEDELERFDPAEAVVGPDAPTAPFADGCMVTPYEHAAFDLETARETVAAYFGSTAMASDAEVRACGALLSYAEYTRGGSSDAARGAGGGAGADAVEGAGGAGADAVEGAGGAGADAVEGAGAWAASGGADAGDGPIDDGRRLGYINHLTRYDPRDYALLDAVALRSLEVFEPRHVHGLEGAALVETLDETASPLGGRELRDWLRRPLLDEGRIDDRLDAVEALLERVGERERALDLLADVYDLERLVAGVSRGRADARDLRALESTLSVVPELRECVAEAAAESALLADVRDRLDDCADRRELVDRAIVESPPVEVTEGGVIADGYDGTLDDLRRTEREGKAWIDDLEAAERERTGIDSLEVGHNSVHGYYIEVTNPNLEAVPGDYQRRQTLKNSERFCTPALEEREDEIIRAEDRAADREYELFRSVRTDVAAETERIQSTAGALAELDALCALATVAAKYDYCRPEVGADGLRIEAGRHPVVERTEAGFVPNPTDLPRERPMAVVTGPNMAGKSTYLRQVALACVMAQVGSFVPARRAELPVVDRVFTRVGASDDIAGGRSTFMVEMTELAAILEDADEDSLVVLDEVGRGTSTRDGYAIAQAATEFLHDEVGAYTLFATHHHELTDVAAGLPRARNYHFSATRDADGIVDFEHDLRDGAAEASYGVEVADTAGVPTQVVRRASDLLDRDAGADVGRTSGGATPAQPEAPANRTASTDGGEHPVDLREELGRVDLADTTPLEALNLLSRLKSRVE